MAYSITRHIVPKKQRYFNRYLQVAIWVVAIPVVIIAVISICLYLFVIWIASLFSKGNDPEHTPYRLELELLKNEHVCITLAEDESDAELTRLNENWMNNVYKEETCLYRAKTNPAIAELEGKVLCFYLKHQPEGVILQMLDHNKAGEPVFLNTVLVLLKFPDLSTARIADAGAYYLYNDEKNERLIKGFNDKETIEIYLDKQ